MDEKEKYEELNKVKENFLTFANHQVKGPLAIIKGYATLISDGTLGEVSEGVKATAGKIRSSADRLLSMAENFTYLRRLTEGDLEYKMEEKNLEETVKKVVDIFVPLGEEKGLGINFDISNFDISKKISIDVEKFSQALKNILDNALKLTEKGEIKVKIFDENGKANIEIADTGKGMPPDFIKNLFEKFENNSLEEAVSGAGFGLYVAYKIIKAHNGELSGVSEGVGKGSAFIIKIPLQ